MDDEASERVVEPPRRRRHLLRHSGHLRRADSEEFLGRALGGRRDDVPIVATKFGMRRGRQERGSRRLRHAGTRSEPSRLGTDLHRPLPAAPARPEDANRRDDRALDDLVKAGKVRETGCSNFTGWTSERGAGTIAEKHNAVHHRAEPLQPAAARPSEAVGPVCEKMGWHCCPTSRWRAGC